MPGERAAWWRRGWCLPRRLPAGTRGVLRDQSGQRTKSDKLEQRQVQVVQRKVPTKMIDYKDKNCPEKTLPTLLAPTQSTLVYVTILRDVTDSRSSSSSPQNLQRKENQTRNWFRSLSTDIGNFFSKVHYYFLSQSFERKLINSVHGCIFFWKILIFPKPVLCVVFDILKLPENFSPKLGYFQEKMRKICKKWGKTTKIKDSEQKIGKNCIF